MFPRSKGLGEVSRTMHTGVLRVRSGGVVHQMLAREGANITILERTWQSSLSIISMVRRLSCMTP